MKWITKTISAHPELLKAALELHLLCSHVRLSSSHVCLQLWWWSLREVGPCWHFSQPKFWLAHSKCWNEWAWESVHTRSGNSLHLGGSPRTCFSDPWEGLPVKAWSFVMPGSTQRSSRKFEVIRRKQLWQHVHFTCLSLLGLHSVFTVRHSGCNWDELPCEQWQPRLTEPFIKMAVC